MTVLNCQQISAASAQYGRGTLRDPSSLADDTADERRNLAATTSVTEQVLLLLLLLHPFNGCLSWTSLVSGYQKGRNNLNLYLNESRDDGVWGWEWHQLNHIQTMCTSLQRDDHINTSSVNFLQAGRSSCRPTNSVKALKTLECVVTGTHSDFGELEEQRGQDFSSCNAETAGAK